MAAKKGGQPQKTFIQRADWQVTATADNAAATATKAAAANKTHFVTSIHGSFSAALIKNMTLKSDVNARGNFHVHNSRDIYFEMPVAMAEGELAELSLAASGAGGTVGAVTMCGFTEATAE